MSTLDNGWNDASPRCWCGGALRDHWRGRECLREPLGGAHPDAWRQAEKPGEERLYVADSVAIVATDPDQAARLLAEAERAREQVAFLIANCPNSDCPSGCPPEHADVGFPEVNCGTFRLAPNGKGPAEAGPG